MKRLSLGSQVLVTCNNVPDALAVYIPSVERMHTSLTVDVPAFTDIDGGDPQLRNAPLPELTRNGARSGEAY